MSMTVEDMKNAVINFVNIAEEEVVSNESEELDNNGVEILNALSELEQYRAIGTVPELRELKEKATVKQVYGVYISEDKIRYECPHCHKYLNYRESRYCSVCGQKLLWD